MASFNGRSLRLCNRSFQSCFTIIGSTIVRSFTELFPHHRIALPRVRYANKVMREATVRIGQLVGIFLEASLEVNQFIVLDNATAEYNDHSSDGVLSMFPPLPL